MADRQNSSGIVAASVYANGVRVREIAIDEAGVCARTEGQIVWIGLLEPSEAELKAVQEQFGLNALAIEDASEAHQRPKLVRYGDVLFIVARTAEIIGDRIAFGETHLFVGRGFVVSIRHGPSASYTRVRALAEASPAMLRRGESYILYAILDFVVDHYLEVVEKVQSEADEIENDMLDERMSQSQVHRLYILRRDLLRLRSGVAPLVEVCRKLERSDMFPEDRKLELLFRDVTDHVRGVAEEIDSLREMLAFCFDASTQHNQAQQIVVSRRLAAWAAILAVPTAMAGIYGMNFTHMPELQWRYGYYLVLGVVISTCVLLFVNFRRRNWL